MRLHDLKPRPGAKHRRKRLGAGESSGRGKTAGKGHKGQKARAGSFAHGGFEGGQMPLYRRLPRRGFNNARFHKNWAIVNVGSLEDWFEAGETVDEATLRERGRVKGAKWAGLKILGSGKLTKKLNIIADKVSASAKEQIEAAGGSVEIIPPKPVAEKGLGKRKYAAKTAPVAAPAVKPPKAPKPSSAEEEAPKDEEPADAPSAEKADTDGADS